MTSSENPFAAASTARRREGSLFTWGPVHVGWLLVLGGTLLLLLLLLGTGGRGTGVGTRVPPLLLLGGLLEMTLDEIADDVLVLLVLGGALLLLLLPGTGGGTGVPPLTLLDDIADDVLVLLVLGGSVSVRLWI